MVRLTSLSSPKMKLLTLIILSLGLHSCRSYQVIRELRKQINDGEILGRYMTSERGRTISAFIGIPFASPPVGNLRFRAPQKVTPWNGTLLTQNERAKCPQIDTIRGSTIVEGNEDCLYVNVYVPETGHNNELDVLVWIYGGVVSGMNQIKQQILKIIVSRVSLQAMQVHLHTDQIIYSSMMLFS